MTDDPIRERVARALMRECYGNAEFPSEAQKASWFKQADAALLACGYEEMRRALEKALPIIQAGAHGREFVVAAEIRAALSRTQTEG